MLKLTSSDTLGTLRAASEKETPMPDTSTTFANHLGQGSAVTDGERAVEIENEMLDRMFARHLNGGCGFTQGRINSFRQCLDDAELHLRATGRWA